ncbi:lanthionine synthetase C family protein [Nostoc commune NIES-4072]|uniref:Lanthionine synthetase C family protein n=1 Tax=Nostoc commune NIES-4072 TaxID=2005467 RepID=A0A2R5FND7_NOSCO|nr:type 2 lanthipeptide synthetase LanM family protein [Nostoc commune]BBD63711.1 lanthionine synthetase C family protein [Nostoc commune HK-02]GBG18968.1 lanthionine synthetase C family protein [Nostoc commune NIES-4072]
MTKSDIAQIVAFASSLYERLSNGLFGVDADQMSEQQAIDERIAHWCQVVAQGNWEKFQKRLLWDGLDIDEVRHALGSVHLAEVYPLPSWAEILSEIIQTGTDFSLHPDATNPDKLPIEPKNPLPFEDVLLPAILVARQKLLTSLGCASLYSNHLLLELLSFAAYLSLERSLLQQLVNLCTKTLELEFSCFRPLGHNLFNLLVKEPTGSQSKAHYNAFVQKLLQDGLLAFFQKYPVLGRLVATAIDLWVEAMVEFVQRLKTDKAEIQQLFLPKQGSKGAEADREEFRSSLSSPYPDSQLGKVIEIRPNLSDPHNRGRSVIVIEFESGLKLVYKPKNLGLEVAHNQFLDWCNQHGVPLPFKVLKVSDRQTYGWVEYVEQLPIEDALAAQRFYQRAGMLLYVLYLLQGTDCHHENLIACGEHLVLVDMETLMHHEASEFADSLEATGAITAAQQLFDSVLRSGLLPRWKFIKDNLMVYDGSGLGSVSPQATALMERWKSVNTDDMHKRFEKTTFPSKANEAILNGVALSPNNYINELVEGFEQMYHFLIAQRSTLLLANGPLAKLQAQQVRFVFRATRVYSVVLENSLAPEFLQNGVDRSIELDILSRAFLTGEDKPKAWPILRSELRAMEQLDIPYFGAKSNSDDLTVGLEQPIERYFKESSHSQVLKRLRVLNETDLVQQVGIIQGAFYAKMAHNRSTKQAKAANTSSATSVDFSDIRLLSAEQLLYSAQAIAQSIQERAIREADGSVSWIGFGFVPNAERFQLQILGHSLYDGNCGIALFLAALERIKGDRQFRDLALGAIQSLRKFIQTADADSAQKFVRAIGIGGASGLGSIIYCLVKMSQFLKESALLEDARRAANLIAPEVIAADRQFDVMAGAGGAILGLLALYDETGEPAVLEKAIACGQHLLAHQISVDGSPRAWKNFKEKPLTGFSHGAAGIAYALLRLYWATHLCAYKEASVEGITYERSVFKTSAANWPDFRSFTQQNGQPGFMVSWCHGAPGIGLARLGSLEFLDTEEIRQDIEAALQTTHKYGLQGIDHLCCGNFGRIDVLLVAAKTLRREELFKTAHLQASLAVARAEQIGGYQLFANLPASVFSPSFFQGTAGIGYGLLRLAYPEILPSVLLLAL